MKDTTVLMIVDGSLNGGTSVRLFLRELVD